MSNGNNEQREKLLHLVQEALQQDDALREKYQMGEKFRFIRDRLKTLLLHVQENLATMKKASEQPSVQMTEDEMFVYVYLYNTQGIVAQTWQKMVSPSVFYEYSVNRPVYTEKPHIEAFIRAKTNKVQHGYLTVIVKKSDIVKPTGAEQTKDPLGHPLVKVKEGSLLFNRLMAFTHQGHDYVVNEAGDLVKKKVNPS